MDTIATTSETVSQDWNSGSRSTVQKFCGRHSSGRSRGGVIRSSASGLSAVSSITAYGASSAAASSSPAALSARRADQTGSSRHRATRR